MGRSSDLAAAFRDHWERCFAPEAGGRVVLAVSGGIDSMTLLALLGRDGLGGADLEPVAACFDHGTRGEEGAADGRFVAEVAERWGVRARLGAGDAPARAAAERRGPMAAARGLRYAFLRAVAEEEGAAAVVTAHQRDDRVETALLRIARGTSVEGLGGPRPIEVRRGLAILRPLLPFPRAAIAAWAEATGVPFRADPSNRSPRFPRTRVREALLPLLREINPRADEAVIRLATRAAADAAALADLARRHLAGATIEREDGRWRLAAARLVAVPDAVLSRAVLLAWATVARPGARPPDADWVDGALAFLRRGRGGAIEGPGAVRLGRSGATVEFAGPGRREEDDGADDRTDAGR